MTLGLDDLPACTGKARIIMRKFRPRHSLTLFTVASIAMLAACGPAAVEGNQEADRNGVEANVAKPAADNAQDAVGLAQYREDSLRGCIGGGRDRAGPNVPVERHCACAVDRVMEGRTMAELEAEEVSGEYAGRFTAAMRQCIAEIPD